MYMGHTPHAVENTHGDPVSYSRDICDDLLLSKARSMATRGFRRAEIEHRLMTLADTRGLPLLTSQQLEEIIAMALAEAAAAPLSLPADDLAFAQFMDDHHDGRLLYSDGEREWRWWSGTHWQAVSYAFVQRLAQATAEYIAGIAREQTGLTEKQQRRILSCLSQPRKRAMILELQSIALADSAIFDTNPYLFCFPNGVYDLAADAFRPHRRQDFITLCVGYDYDPAATYDAFMTYLCTSLGGRADLIAFVQDLIGYLFFGGNPEQIVIYLVGQGKNGKSLLISVLRALLGPYAGGIPAAALLASNRNDAKRGEMARHRLTRLLVALEFPEGRKLNEAAIKGMSGEDQGTACPKYGDYIDYTPDFTAIFTGNKLPVITGDDDGIWRRWVFMPWDTQIPEEQRDRQLRHKLTRPEVLAGIFNFGLEGYRRYAQRGALYIPPMMELMVQHYRRNVCDVQEFVDAECATAAQIGRNPDWLRAPVRTLYEAYRLRRMRNHEPHLNLQYFSRRLTELGFPTDRKEKGGIRFKMGIMLNH